MHRFSLSSAHGTQELHVEQVLNGIEILEFLFGEGLKKVKIPLDKLIAIVISNGLSPLCGIADVSRAYS